LGGRAFLAVNQTQPNPTKPKTENKKMKIKTTTEGSQFISQRFEAINTVEKWIAAFPARYSNLHAKIAKAFAARDMRNAQ
jgi:hypothetical protein